MAAYGALVSLINDLELIPSHPIHSFSFDDKQITSLSQTVKFLIDFMETYDSHGCSRESVEVLESQIAATAHAAHDVIESHIVDQIHAGSTLAADRKAISYFFLDLQYAIDSMEFVKRKAMQFKAKSGSKAEHPTYSGPSPSIASEHLKNVLVGFDEVVLRLLEILTGEPSNQRLVVPIVGMGGIGKTTLTRNVYDHSHVEHRFDVRLWAIISQKYSAENILNELLSRRRESNTDKTVSDLKEELHKKLWGRRYLIVLDDMWSVEAWDEIHMFLPDNGNGSRIIITTRLSNLAKLLSSSPFDMKFIDNNESWRLFCGNAFGEEHCPAELEEIGKKIVKRCKGLPLSIVVIRGHFRRSSRAIEYWESVSNYMNPISSLGEEEQCLEVLRLSYEHLPAYLKSCFLYMGIFKEDKLIHTSELFQLWIGEGFLKPNDNLSLEELGENYLTDLIGRNLILVRERRWNGKVRSCGIHDVVRELCLKVGEKEKFVGMVNDTATQGCLKRRIVIPEGNTLNSKNIGGLQSAPLLRSLIYQGGYMLSNVIQVDFRLLRVLTYVNDTNYDPFQQVNLRFLSLKVPYYTYLPISAFWNLQTLIVKNFDEQMTFHDQMSTDLPCEIWEMPQLRHLQFFRVCLPDPVLDGGTNQKERIVLRNLQTLKGVKNLRITEEVCERIPNIKDLSLVYDNSCGDYYLHNLGCFRKLKSLTCKLIGDNSKWHEVVLSFTFPTSLEELDLENCHLHWEDVTIMAESLPHLGSLRLSAVHGSEWNLDGEEFDCLKILEICGCNDLTYLNADNSNFPVLEALLLENVPELSEILSEIGEIPTLKRIQIRDCSSMSVAVSAMDIVVAQESEGNDCLQLYVQFRNWETLELFQNVLQEEDLRSNSLHLTYQAMSIARTKRR